MRTFCIYATLAVTAFGRPLVGEEARDLRASAAFAPTDLPEVGTAKLKALPLEDQAQAATRAAVFWIQRGEFLHAETYLRHAEALPDAAQGGEGTALLVCLRAQIASAKGDPRAAIALYKRAAASVSEGGQEAILLAVLEQQLAVEHAHGFLAEALQTATQLMKIAEARQDRYRMASTLYERGMILFKLRRIDESTQAAERARALYTTLQLSSGLAECDKLLGNLCSARGEQAQALAYYEAAYGVFKAAGNFQESANCRLNAALVYEAEAKPQKADEYLDEAIVLFTRAGSLGGVGLCHYAKGASALERGDYLKAGNALHLAEKMFSESQNLFRLAQIKQALSNLYKKQGNISMAADYLSEAENLFVQVNGRR